MTAFHAFSYFLLTILVGDIGADNYAFQREVYVRLGQIDPCEGNTFKIRYTEVAVERVEKDKYSVSGILSVEEEIDDFNVRMNLYSCTSADFDDCQLYADVESNGCEELKHKNGIAYKMFQSAKQEVECPIPPGKYVLEKYMVEISPTESVPASEVARFWQARIEGYKHDEIIMCTLNNVELDRSQ